MSHWDELEEKIPRVVQTMLREKGDRLGPASAGILTGAVGGALTLLATQRLIAMRGGANIVDLLGRFASRGHFTGTNATIAAFASVAIAGAVLGASFALLTRHLRRFVPVFFFASILLPTLWTGLYALSIRAGLTHLSSILPFSPTLIGTLVLAFSLAMQVPIRVRA